MSLSRRKHLQVASVALPDTGRVAGTPATRAALPRARADMGAASYESGPGQAHLTPGRRPDDQNRPLSSPRSAGDNNLWRFP
ncbi:hypothetical protein [Streptosporangium sp. NPDC048865]|uniref:hypothetical protein n=1 Tax=Streptosporangium sp. NPDC048865 TaxID=3155766 RepID=UPI00344AAD1C